MGLLIALHYRIYILVLWLDEGFFGGERELVRRDRRSFQSVFQKTKLKPIKRLWNLRRETPNSLQTNKIENENLIFCSFSRFAFKKLSKL